MKPFRMFIRSIRDAFKSVIRNFSLSIASISCISITLIVVAIALIASINVEKVTKNIKNDVTIVAFAKKKVSDTDITAIRKELDSLDNIDTYTFKSKLTQKEEIIKEEEAFKFMENWSDEEIPLRDSFLIKVKVLEEIKETVEKIKKIDNIEIVDYGESTVEKLLGAFRLVERITIAMVLVLLVVTVFLIINTIKLTIFSRKREISIMRLVGASNFTIKNPFVIEGLIIGAIGSIVPIILTIYGYIALYNHFDGQLFSSLFKLIKPEPFVYMISAVILVMGMVVGMIGSGRAVRKYLKI